MERISDDLEIYDLEDLLAESEEYEPSANRRGQTGRGRNSDVGTAPAKAPVTGNRKAQNAKRTGGKAKKTGGVPIWVHLLILLVIAAAVVTAVIRLKIWNKGVRNEVDPSLQSKFSIEVNDSMVLLPASRLEGREDDGVTTVLCLGGNPFSDDLTETGLAAQIEQLGEKALGREVEVLNASFPESQVTCLNPKYETESIEDLEDIFNLFYVAYALSLDNYESLKTVAGLHPDDPRYTNSIETLENVDLDKVDIITIMYDSTDYENGMPIVNMQYEDELTTYTGAMRNAYKLIRDAYPHIRIVFLSPTYMQHKAEDGSYTDGRTTDLGNGTLIQYWQWAFDTCAEMSVSFLDNYYGSVNDSNYKEYLTDNMHLNADGRTKIADHFVYKVLLEEYAEYDANSLAVAE
ncbi:MAG: hypothetical protein IJV14_02900 [Lachnospiraceae bacterium]|nr:hypothetical protein [Lachnospiraceae bacterium]